jgi:uncharacterized protein
MPFNLTILPGRFAVCRLDPLSLIPAWAYSGAISSVTLNEERGWACLKLQGPFEFTLTGVLTSVLVPLRDAGIGIFALSTFDTDYVLVPGERLEDAVQALVTAGHTVT